MRDFLQTLQNSHFAVWVQTSIWGYQIILTLHSVGLAFLVGVSIVVDMRLLGLARAVRLSALHSAMAVVWIGFIVNAVTGLMLFTADAERFFFNVVFRYKLVSILVGMALAAYIDRSVLRSAPRLQDKASTRAPSAQTRLLATLSLAAWAGAITCGRLVAYHG